MAAYTLCATHKAVKKAVNVLSTSDCLVIDCEGKDLGQKGGVLALMCIGVVGSGRIFLFDTVTLPYDNPVMASLLNILKDERVTKVMWDGRKDYLEILDNYGVALGGVVDLQLAEVTSRSTIRGESEKMRLHRLSTGYLSFRVVKTMKESLAGIHLVIGLQKCLEQTNLARSVSKDEEVVSMHRANGGAPWLNRPLSPQLLKYAANDIRAMLLLYTLFLQRNWINLSSLPKLKDQSKRYITTQQQQGRSDDTNAFRMGCLLPLDVLTPPTGTLEYCLGCKRDLSLYSFENLWKEGTIVRRPRCRLCAVIAEKRKMSPDQHWLRITAGNMK